MLSVALLIDNKYLRDKADQLEAKNVRLREALGVAKDIIDHIDNKFFHEAFCDGVHAENGSCHGEYLAWCAYKHIIEILQGEDK